MNPQLENLQMHLACLLDGAGASAIRCISGRARPASRDGARQEHEKSNGLIEVGVAIGIGIKNNCIGRKKFKTV